MTLTIEENLNSQHPCSFARTNDGILLITNGIDRGMRYDPQLVTARKLGIDAPIASPTVALAPSSGGGSALTVGSAYICYYRYIDEDENPKSSNLSPVTVTDAVVDEDEFDWTGLSATTQQRIRKVELWRSLGGETELLFRVGSYGAQGNIINVSGTTFTTEEPHNLVQDCRVIMQGVVAQAESVNSNTMTVLTVPTETTFTASGGAVTNYDHGGTWTLEGKLNDILTDADLIALPASDKMRIFINEGRLNANRHDPPPNFKSVIVTHKDRAWYAVDIEYTLGSISVTEGSTTVTGTTTNWTVEMVGRYIYTPGARKPLVISAFVSATELTLAEGYPGATASLQAYTIKPAPSERNVLYFSEQDEYESVPAAQNKIRIQDQTGDDDEITGMCSHGAFLYIFRERSLYRLYYNSQPIIDDSTQVHLVAMRGCLNQRCWARHEGITYVMDEGGVYSFTNQGIQLDNGRPLGEPLADLFRPDGAIDFSKKKWFSARYDARRHVVRFYVKFKTDIAETRPLRELIYNVRTGAWEPQTRFWAVGGCTQAETGGELRSWQGTEEDRIYLIDEGTLDGTQSAGGATRGTATGSQTTTTLQDTSQTIATDVVNSPISIIAGTGKGQTRQITVRNTANQVTVDTAWTTPPVAGSSVYQIGGVEWSWRGGMNRYTRTRPGQPKEIDVNSGVRITYQPTAVAAELDLRRYNNHDAAAEVIDTMYNQGGGWKWSADGTEDVVLDMTSASGSGTSQGSAWLPIDISGDDAGEIDRWLSVELHGWQGEERIQLFELEIEGVE